MKHFKFTLLKIVARAIFYFEQLIKEFHVGVDHAQYIVHFHNRVVVHIYKVQVNVRFRLVNLTFFVRMHL